MLSNRHVRFLPLIVTFSLVGCGSGHAPTYPTSGKVTFTDGKTLGGGSVSFRSLDEARATSARGMIQPDGSFVLTTFEQGDGAVEGRHQALVSVPISPEQDDYKGGPPPAAIDSKFSSFTTSGLEFTVSTDPEQNRFEIKVTPPKRR